VFYALWLLEINGESEKNGTHDHASEHLTRAGKTQKRRCKNTKGMPIAAEIHLIQFVIQR